MASESGLQDSVEKAREAFRSSTPSEGGEGFRLTRSPLGETEARAMPGGLDPFFRGLLETLPEPGAEWPKASREQWLETARNIFALIYVDPPEEREPHRFRQAQQERAQGDSPFDRRTG